MNYRNWVDACLVLGSVALVVFTINWVYRSWRQRKAHRARMAAVYGKDAVVETDPLILTPERVKFRIPRPEDIGETDEPN